MHSDVYTNPGVDPAHFLLSAGLVRDGDEQSQMAVFSGLAKVICLSQQSLLILTTSLSNTDFRISGPKMALFAKAMEKRAGGE